MRHLLPLLLLIGCVDPTPVDDGPSARDTARFPAILADGALELHFTRPGVEPHQGEDPELDDSLGALFDSAQSSIDLSLYEFDRQEVVDSLLDAIDRGVTVRFVGDGDEEHDDGYEQLVAAGLELSLRKKRDRIMHNKFVLVDERWVFTGSTNLSENGVMRNNNHGMVIDSPLLAEHYLVEFEQMFEEGLFGRKKSSFDHSAPSVLSDEILDVHFAPADEPHLALLDMLATADHSVFFMIFSFTRRDLADRMITLHESGVQVVGIFDESQGRSRYAMDDYLAERGVPVYIDGNHNSSGFAGGKMHHKVMLIDALTSSDPVVSIGSYNWSASATKYNDENLIVVDGPETSAAFAEEFCARLAEATPHPSYVGELPDPCSGLITAVRINEIMANPAGSDSQREWVEIVNAGAAAVDLTGWTLGDKTKARHVFDGLVLGADEAVVVGGSGVEAPNLDLASGSLSLTNSSDSVVLSDAEGNVVDRVEYQRAASGVSFNRDPDGGVSGDLVLHTELGGDASPGLTAEGLPWGANLVINEALPNPTGTDAGSEYVELINPNAEAIDLGGWTLGDLANPARHVFEPGTLLGPGEVLVIFDSGDHSDVPNAIVSSTGSLSLNNSNESVTVTDEDGTVRDTFSWTSSTQGKSWNRALDGSNSDIVRHDTLGGLDTSPGLRFDGQPWGAVLVINEVLPNPDGSDAGQEWVEIVNVGAADADLSDWTLGDAVNPARHVFAFNTTLVPGASLVIFDSGSHPEVPGSIVSSTGSLSLNNTGEVVELRDSEDVVISAVQWTSSASGVSLNRQLDGDPLAPLVNHDEVGTGASSPGTRADGTPW